jgi:hypothetical protein
LGNDDILPRNLNCVYGGVITTLHILQLIQEITNTRISLDIASDTGLPYTGSDVIIGKLGISTIGLNDGLEQMWKSCQLTQTSSKIFFKCPP